MDDLERWLRATMAAATQEPPRDLLAGVWRRRRLHQRQIGASSVAAVAAIAIVVPSVLLSTAGDHPSNSAASATTLRAAPGSELLRCGIYSGRGISGGELSARWKAVSIQAGQVWFVDARDGAWRSSVPLPGGRLRDVPGIILAVRNGTAEEITTPQSGRFRFVTRHAAHGSYTMRDGVAGVTLVGCASYPIPRGMPEAMAAGLTLFYLPLGYVTDLTGCLPVQVRTPPSWKVRWTGDIPLNGGHCAG
jgi:hypothetical protein